MRLASFVSVLCRHAEARARVSRAGASRSSSRKTTDQHAPHAGLQERGDRTAAKVEVAEDAGNPATKQSTTRRCQRAAPT